MFDIRKNNFTSLVYIIYNVIVTKRWICKLEKIGKVVVRMDRETLIRNMELSKQITDSAIGYTYGEFASNVLGVWCQYFPLQWSKHINAHCYWFV